MIKKTQILPSLLIIIQAASAVPYAVKGNWRMAVYWTAAAVLNVAITF